MKKVLAVILVVLMVFTGSFAVSEESVSVEVGKDIPEGWYIVSPGDGKSGIMIVYLEPGFSLKKIESSDGIPGKDDSDLLHFDIPESQLLELLNAPAPDGETAVILDTPDLYISWYGMRKMTKSYFPDVLIVNKTGKQIGVSFDSFEVNGFKVDLTNNSNIYLDDGVSAFTGADESHFRLDASTLQKNRIEEIKAIRFRLEITVDKDYSNRLYPEFSCIVDSFIE